MEIKISEEDELNELLNSLAQDIIATSNYHRLYSDLLDSRKDYTREFSQSPAFWSLIWDSLSGDRMIRLCRIFDQESKSLNLINLVDTIKANMHFFEEEPFRERLKGNAFVDSLAEVGRIPNENQIEEDILFASEKNPTVKKLIIWRNNVIAHKRAKVSLGKSTIMEDNPLTREEIETLITECFVIFNRYSSLYKAEHLSGKMVGHDDYKSLLDFIRRGLQKWDEDIAREYQRFNRKQPEKNTPGNAE